MQPNVDPEEEAAAVRDGSRPSSASSSGGLRTPRLLPPVRLSQRAAALDMMEARFGTQLKQKGIEYKTSVLTFATDCESVGELIVANATDLGAAAIILASHGKGRIKEWFLGSVTTHCTHRAKTPVIVVPPERD